jgi:hypothetical protein
MNGWFENEQFIHRADAPPLALLEPPGELARAWAARKRKLRDAA